MKKIFHFALVVLFTSMFINCSSSSVEEVYSIVGTWSFSQSIENGIDVLSDCERNGTVTFNEDKSFEGKYFALNNSNCVLDDTSTGTWSKLNNGEYTLVSKQVTISFSGENTLIVRENGKEDYEVCVR